MARKRRAGGGRVTPSKRSIERTQAAGVPPTTSSERRRTTGSASPPGEIARSSRYTPAKAAFRKRPRWHRIAGWLGIALGIAIAIVNDAMLFTKDTFLPFGHQEFYLLLGLAVAASSTWFLGLFDRGTTVYD